MPTESDLWFVRSEDTKSYIRQLPPHPRQPLLSVFPHVNPLAIDLMEKMLTFDPAKRITGNFTILFRSFLCFASPDEIY